MASAVAAWAPTAHTRPCSITLEALSREGCERIHGRLVHVGPLGAVLVLDHEVGARGWVAADETATLSLHNGRRRLELRLVVTVVQVERWIDARGATEQVMVRFSRLPAWASHEIERLEARQPSRNRARGQLRAAS